MRAAWVALTAVLVTPVRAQAPAAKEPMRETTSSAAPAAAKQAPPPAGRPRDFKIPAASRSTLPNGLRVTLVPWGTVPKATVSLVVDAGNVYEARDQAWLADLTGRMLEQGTLTRSAAELAEAAARMGGELELNVGADRVTLGADVLGEFADDLLLLLADVVKNPRWPESELARLEADLQRQLAVELAQSQPLARDKFRRVLYGDHPYGRLYPTAAQLEALTLEHVKAFYRDNWGASRAQLFVVGVFDAPSVQAALREAFADWPAGSPARPPLAAPRAERSLHVVDRPGAVQSTLLVGLPVVDPSHPDWLPLTVTHTLLAGSFASRITANIREDKGYTYSPQGQLSARRRDAYWAEEADVSTAVTGAALGEILREVERLRAEPPTDSELDAVKSYLAGIFVLRNSNRGAIIAQLDFVDLHGLGPEYLSRYVTQVQGVTPQLVQDMARKHIDPARLALVVVGDRQAIAAQLERFEK